ncbi:hypothetical protein HYW20_04235 [Candidatus Woesearchaeota archaeon]|nr:hypothetical protein [Candidatus Woesearchaeota archaeon]
MTNIHKLKEFIKNNYKLIFSNADLISSIKDLKKRKFVLEWNKQFGVPSEKEIADEATISLIEMKRIENEEQLNEQIKNIPFLRAFVTDINKFKGYLVRKDVSILISKEDIVKHKDEEFVRQRIGKVLEEEKKKYRQEIEEGKRELEEEKIKTKAEIEREKKQLEELKTELESYKVKEEEINAKLDIFLEEDSKKTSSIWWEKLGLIADPFPGENRGLWQAVESRFFNKDVDLQEKYDFFSNLLIRNPIFDDFEKKIVTYPMSFLNNTFILLGAFGSGKTVLFEFIAEESTKNNMLVIEVLLDVYKETTDMFRDFYRGILSSKTIKRHYEELFNTKIGSVVQNYDKEEVCEILNEIKHIRNYMGVVIIIDGLHKGQSPKSALNFIVSLQNFSDRLVKDGIGTSMIIAGGLDWRIALKEDPSLSGSISKNNVIELPEVDVPVAYNMLNKRFLSFANDTQKAITVQKANIERLYMALKKRISRPLAFRDYIDELIPSLKEGDIKNIHIHPLYSKEIISNIFDELNTNHYGLLTKLIKIKEFFSKKPGNAIKLIRFLSSVSFFVSKEDELYMENPSFFSMLLHFGLLEPGYSKERTGLKLSEEIRKFSLSIKEKYGYGFNEFIVELMKSKILELDNEKIEKDTIREEIRILENILYNNPNIKEKYHSEFQKMMEIHNQILRTSLIDEHIVEKTKESIKELLNILFIIVGLPSSNISYQKLNNKLLSHSYKWLFEYVKEYLEFSGKIYHLEKTFHTHEVREYQELYSDYNRSFLSIVRLIHDLIRSNSILSLNRHYLLLSDIDNLHKIRKYFLDEEYKKSVDFLNEFYEHKMRCNLYNILNIKYGDKYKSRLGAIVNQVIMINRQKSRKSLIISSDKDNILFDCDRTNYVLIILGEYQNQNNKRENWEQIFTYIFENFPLKSRLENHFTVIHPFITGSAHNWNKRDWEQNSDKLKEAIVDLADLSQSLNKSYSLLLEPKNIHIEDEKIYFSFYEGLNDKQHLSPLNINKEIFESIADLIRNNIKNKKYLILMLEDYEEIEFKYRCKYREFIGVLAMYIKKGELQLKFSKGNYLLIRKPQNGGVGSDLNGQD